MLILVLASLAQMAALTLAFGAGSAPYLIGQAASLALVVPSFWTLAGAMRQPNKRFFAVFAGGVLFRVSGFALLAAAVYRYTDLSLTAVLLSWVGGMSVLTVCELILIQRGDGPIRAGK